MNILNKLIVTYSYYVCMYIYIGVYALIVAQKCFINFLFEILFKLFRRPVKLSMPTKCRILACISAQCK